MSQDWKICVQPAERAPYEFRATFVLLRSGGARGMLEARYLYGDGDLAVFLEDLGADSSEIWNLLERLKGEKIGEISIDMTEEALEVLAREPSSRWRGSGAPP